MKDERPDIIRDEWEGYDEMPDVIRCDEEEWI